MRIRYVLYRLGADPGEIEIDEALPLVELYHEERAQVLCPLVAQGG
jgi:hypothetical protein